MDRQRRHGVYPGWNTAKHALGRSAEVSTVERFWRYCDPETIIGGDGTYICGLTVSSTHIDAIDKRQGIKLRLVSPSGLFRHSPAVAENEPTNQATTSSYESGDERIDSGARLSQPWKCALSPATHDSRNPGLLRFQSGRISLVASRRSCQRSLSDGRPQNH